MNQVCNFNIKVSILIPLQNLRLHVGLNIDRGNTLDLSRLGADVSKALAGIVESDARGVAVLEGALCDVIADLFWSSLSSDVRLLNARFHPLSRRLEQFSTVRSVIGRGQA